MLGSRGSVASVMLTFFNSCYPISFLIRVVERSSTSLISAVNSEVGTGAGFSVDSSIGRLGNSDHFTDVPAAVGGDLGFRGGSGES